MRQVIGRGTGLVDDPARLCASHEPVTAVGVDETAYLRATARHSTTFVTGIADLTPGRPARLLDVVEGRSGTVLAGWLSGIGQPRGPAGVPGRRALPLVKVAPARTGRSASIGRAQRNSGAALGGRTPGLRFTRLSLRFPYALYQHRGHPEGVLAPRPPPPAGSGTGEFAFADAPSRGALPSGDPAGAIAGAGGRRAVRRRATAPPRTSRPGARTRSAAAAASAPSTSRRTRGRGWTRTAGRRGRPRCRTRRAGGGRAGGSGIAT
jgi:hypothetical protein